MNKCKDILIKVKDAAAGGFVTIAGMRSRRLIINGDTVQPEQWASFAKDTPIRRASFAGRGLFKNASADTLIRQTFFEGAVKDYQVIIPDFGAIEGAFQIAGLEFAGEHNGDVTYELLLESAGPAEYRFAVID